jgi:hypothetical protein
MAGVSKSTQRTAERVAKASPEKIQEVARGEKTLPQATQHHITPSKAGQIRKIVLHPPLHDWRKQKRQLIKVGVSV